MTSLSQSQPLYMWTSLKFMKTERELLYSFWIQYVLFLASTAAIVSPLLTSDKKISLWAKILQTIQVKLLLTYRSVDVEPPEFLLSFLPRDPEEFGLVARVLIDDSQILDHDLGRVVRCTVTERAPQIRTSCIPCNHNSYLLRIYQGLTPLNCAPENIQL